jgi:DNA-binding response OmpR family regulator
MAARLDADQPQILIVEDDENLRLVLADNLESEGYAVSAAATGQEARAALAEQAFDLILLDIMLPDTDGYTLCEELRRNGNQASVLMLTARTLEDDLIRGFDAGADDYLAKPYRLRELLARVKALLRRSAQPEREESSGESKFVFAGYRLDVQGRRLTGRDGRAIELTKTEFDLLVCLVRNRDCAMTRERLLDQVWGDNLSIDLRTVDNFVSSLKHKLGWNEGAGFRILTLRGVGYRMEFDDEPPV